VSRHKPHAAISASASWSITSLHTHFAAILGQPRSNRITETDRQARETDEASTEKSSGKAPGLGLPCTRNMHPQPQTTRSGRYRVARRCSGAAGAGEIRRVRACSSTVWRQRRAEPAIKPQSRGLGALPPLSCVVGSGAPSGPMAVVPSVSVHRAGNCGIGRSAPSKCPAGATRAGLGCRSVLMGSKTTENTGRSDRARSSHTPRRVHTPQMAPVLVRRAQASVAQEGPHRPQWR
jgi:hypothetical protein